jgi:hypothetical protein
MAENLGVAIDLSGGEVHTTTLSPTSPPSSENVFMESYDVACHLRDLMAESANIDGTRKFREWPYVHHLSTRSNSTGCSSLTTSGLEIAFISGNHASAFNHQELKKAPTGTQGSLGRKWIEYNMLGFRSPMRGLPVSSIYAPSAISYLLLLI